MTTPQVLRQGVQTYDELRQAGYTALVVYMAQQIQQFQRLGKEFAMQHLGTEDEMVKVISERVATMPPEQLVQGLESAGTVGNLLDVIPPDQRLKGLSPEDRLKGLTPEEVEHLKELLQRQTGTDDTSNPG